MPAQSAAPTLAQQFAAEHARNVVPGMLRTIKHARWASNAILIGALSCSYVHQAVFLDRLGAGLFGYVLPLIFDTAMVAMLQVVKTVGMAADAKRAARVVFVLVALASGIINAAAPGSAGLRALFAFVVAVVIGVEWVAGKIRPDFSAIVAREAEAVAVTARKLDPQVAKARAAKAAMTRRANLAAKAAEDAAKTRASKAARAKRTHEATVDAELDFMLSRPADGRLDQGMAARRSAAAVSRAS